jgi:hypothetical protein
MPNVDLSEREKNALWLLLAFRIGDLTTRQEILAQEGKEDVGNARVIFNSWLEADNEINMLKVIKGKLQ